MLTIGLTHYIVLSCLLLSFGVAVMATKRNAIGILIGSELVLNAAVLNFAAFGRYRVGGVDGQISGIFVIVLAAAEAAIALAIFLNFYATHATVDVDRGDALKG
ncbi:MAG: NADH-quinone oxidoreductase subunit NuoK [Planctomycetes bacterium]|nr:NADH-quinone oxidoreductase subunit NuoK [Planctomycetota bacterium]